MTSNFNHLNNLQQRVVTAVIALSLLIPALVLSAWAYFTIFFALCALAQLEFYGLLMGSNGNQPLRYYGTFLGLSVYTLAFLVERAWLPPAYYFLIAPLAASVFFIKLYKKADLQPFANIGYTFLGVIYVAVPLALLHVFVLRGGVYHYQLVLGSLILLWASDTGAYFAGKSFGRTKLFERVSPKKTWEGSAGGAVVAVAAALGLSFQFRDLASWQWLVIAVIIVVTGTYGDLVESLFKRSIAIKDSGSVLPGHGGFLDRFDGLFLSIPFIAAFLQLF